MTMISRHQAIARRRPRTAFSLVELVMVVSIIGIITAIAVPRISRGAKGANSSALKASVNNIRKAIDQYYAEHGSYPGYDPTTKAPDNAMFADQLLKFTDIDGNVSDTPGNPYLYGPYLRPPFPENPVNGLTLVHVKATPASAEPAAGAAGWVAVLSHGYFYIAATDAELGKLGVDVAQRTRLRTE